MRLLPALQAQGGHEGREAVAARAVVGARHARDIGEHRAEDHGQYEQRGGGAQEVLGFEVQHFRLLVPCLVGRLAPCESPCVLVLYITTTPMQMQPPNPNFFGGAFQAIRRERRRRESTCGPSYCLFWE